MPSVENPSSIILSRKHPILRDREQQLALNRLAADGGRAYVNARLHRAPNESDLSWFGRLPGLDDAGRGSFGTVGRKERTTYINDAGRIVNKIQQYLFKDPVSRDGADPAFLANVGGQDFDALQFWMNVSEMLTVGQWVWIQASRDALSENLAALGSGDAVRWTAYPSVAVPDWCLDETGALVWIIVETREEVRADPFAGAKERRVRTLWRRDPDGGGVTVTRFSDRAQDGTGGLWTQGPDPVALDALPFVLVGRPSPRPWWFDDVENAQALMLNLQSVHDDNLVRSVFPQLVLPKGAVEDLQARLEERMGADAGERILRTVREVVRGADTPLVEDAEGKGVSRFIAPNASDLQAIPGEIDRLRKLLFDITGLGLFNNETRQTQTAESKQFDQLDTESTLRNRSMLMQNAETHLVEISRALDPAFKAYSPVWPTSFDVVDAAADMQVITLAQNLPDATPAMRKMALKSAVRIMESISGHDAKLADEARDEIDALTFPEVTEPDDFGLNDHGNQNDNE